MTIISIMAGFAFGYCVMDIIQNYRTRHIVDEMRNIADDMLNIVNEMIKSTKDVE